MKIQLLAFSGLSIISLMLIFFIKTKNKENIWYGGFLFSLSLGLLAFTIDPFPAGHYRDQITFYELTARLLSALSYRFSPYFLLLAGLSVSGVTFGLKPRLLRLITALPIIVGFGCDFIYPRVGFIHIYLDYSPAFWSLAIWGFSYAVLANLLILYSVFKEADPRARLQKILVAIITAPSIFVTYQSYIIPIEGGHDFTQITAGFGTFVFILFFLFAIRYGILGLKINVEKDAFDASLKMVNTGSGMLNHAIRNNIQLIDLAAQNLKLESDAEKRERFYTIIENSTRHLLGFVSRLHHQTRQIELIKKENSLTELLEGAITMVRPILDQHGVELQKNFDYQGILLGDPVHLVEVFVNILTNAVEAIPGRGIIQIDVFKKRKYIIITFRDNGVGIKKADLKRITEPFFSTKGAGEQNFGLGLTYCYNVLQKHHGKLKIESAPNQGTTVIVMLPG